MDPFEHFEKSLGTTPMDMYAAQLHEIYKAFIRAGFTDEQGYGFVVVLFGSHVGTAGEGNK